MKTISTLDLANVTGGCWKHRRVKPIPEDGGVAGPVGSPTPKPPIPEDGGVVGQNGSPTPF
jgi:hypothetical protein